MMLCNDCDTWYHIACLEISRDFFEKNKIDGLKCFRCLKSGNPQHNNVWSGDKAIKMKWKRATARMTGSHKKKQETKAKAQQSQQNTPVKKDKKKGQEKKKATARKNNKQKKQDDDDSDLRRIPKDKHLVKRNQSNRNKNNNNNNNNNNKNNNNNNAMSIELEEKIEERQEDSTTEMLPDDITVNDYDPCEIDDDDRSFYSATGKIGKSQRQKPNIENRNKR